MTDQQNRIFNAAVHLIAAQIAGDPTWVAGKELNEQVAKMHVGKAVRLSEMIFETINSRKPAKKTRTAKRGSVKRPFGE